MSQTFRSSAIKSNFGTWTLILSKLVSIFFPIITIPIIIQVFGNKFFGIYVTISALLILFSLLDFGYTSILHSSIPKITNKTEIREIYLYLRHCQIKSLIIPSFLVFITWSVLLNTRTQLSESIFELVTALLAGALGYFAYLIGNITNRMIVATSQLIRAGILTILGNFLTFLFVLLCCTFFKNFYLLCFGIFGIQGLLAMIYHYVFLQEKGTGKSFKKTLREHKIHQIQITLIQLAYILGFQLDSVLVAKFLGFENVSEFALYQKIYSVPIALFSIYYLPVWTKSAEGFTNLKSRTKTLVIAQLSLFMLMGLTLFLLIPKLSLKQYSLNLCLWLAFQFYLTMVLITVPIVNFLNGQFKWNWILKSVAAGLIFNGISSVIGLRVTNWSGSVTVASALTLFFTLWIPFRFSSMWNEYSDSDQNFWKARKEVRHG